MTLVPTVGDSAKGRKHHHRPSQWSQEGGEQSMMPRKMDTPAPNLDLGTQVMM